MLISPNKSGLGTHGHPGAVAGLPAEGRRAEKMPGGRHRVKSGFSGREGSDLRAWALGLRIPQGAPTPVLPPGSPMHISTGLASFQQP